MKSKTFVFDTNCLVSSLLIPSSIARLAHKKADESGVLIFSMETLAELKEVLTRPKFDKYINLQKRLDFIQGVEARSEFIETSSIFTDCRDIKDNKFLALVYDGEADCISTGDADLLILNPFNRIPIISPADFLNNFAV